MRRGFPKSHDQATTRARRRFIQITDLIKGAVQRGAGAIAENPVNDCVRRPIDAIVEQDRQKLLLNMRDLLESISEYIGGVRTGCDAHLKAGLTQPGYEVRRFAVARPEAAREPV